MNTRLSAFVSADANQNEGSQESFHALLRQQREQILLVQQLLAERTADLLIQPVSPLSVDVDQVQRLAVELGRMGDLVDRLLSAGSQSSKDLTASAGGEGPEPFE